MEFKEVKKFTEVIVDLLNDNDYKELQEFLIINPKAGDVIKKTGGLRKIRWSTKTKGKSGGIRTLYYYADINNIIFMIYAYPKSKTDNITDEQAKIFKKMIDTIKKELKNG
jgi:mRNA-degrading endonuclease RelE of RelBE toxin-antitoxin system